MTPTLVEFPPTAGEHSRQARTDIDRRALALEAGQIGVWEWDIATDHVWWSPQVHEITKVPVGAFPSTLDGFLALLDPDVRATVRTALETAVHGGRPYHLELRIRNGDGGTTWIETRGLVVSESDSIPRTMVGTAVDITERKETEQARDQMLREEQRARSLAESARQRLLFLTTAGRELRAVLDPDVVRRTAVELVVRDLGDWAVIIDTTAACVIAGAGIEFDALPEIPASLRLSAPFEPFRAVLTTGEARLFADPVSFRLLGDDPSMSVTLDATSIMAVPLTLASETIGIMVAGHRRTVRPYESEDLDLFSQYAESVAATVVKASLFTERTAIANALQQSLLPASLPSVAGVEIETEYLPVGEGLIVGGDFYDVFRVSDGTYAFAVGDVSGKGSEAAAVTALVRHSIRAFAETHADPAEVLTAVNETIRIHRPSLRYCTAVFGVLTTDDGAKVHLAVGGHPLPLILRADGTIETAGVPGTLLGMFPEVSVTSTSHTLAPGDAIILYTDGVVDCRKNGVPFGDERLHAVLADSVGESAREVAARIRLAVAGYQDRPSDDVAVMVLRTHTRIRSEAVAGA